MGDTPVLSRIVAPSLPGEAVLDDPRAPHPSPPSNLTFPRYRPTPISDKVAPKPNNGAGPLIARILTLAGGLAGAASLSQFPEFTQQYTQRLAGAVDELSRVVEDFDASARAEGLTRPEALSAMTGTPFVERRRIDMTRTLQRHAELRADLAALRGAGPFTRAYQMSHLDDSVIAKRAVEDFRPALPLTFEGITFAGVGLVLGALAMSLIANLVGMLLWPLRRRATTS